MASNVDSSSIVTQSSNLDKRMEQTIFKVYKAFIAENNLPDIVHVLLQEEVNMHYSIVTDCSALLKVDLTLADVLFFQSSQAFDILNRALTKVCEEVYSSYSLKAHMTLKPYVHARIRNLPVCPEVWRDRVPKSKDIGKFLAVEGTVIKTSSVKLLEFEKELMCSKCKNIFSLRADFAQYYKIPTPPKCPVRPSCNSKKFVMVTGDSSSSGRKCKDYQEIKIQEQMRHLAMGTIPRSMTVVLEDDLVDGCKAGDDVIIYGPLLCRWQQSQQGKPCDIELVLKANYVEVRNEQRLGASVREEMQNDFECFWAANPDSPMAARNHIIASVCPQIYGLYVVKLAVALVLAGGVPRTDNSGSRVRGEAHLLLVGDPGTGKSQFLKYATKITSRSVLTTGIGSTTAGLTVTAVRDGAQWSLEAGALVLADGGICCIDEFSSIKEHDRGAIHEAMEQQTVSVAKAGLVCKLHTRTSILAATNPKLGKYDESASIDLNVAIASPLLSRFDIVLVLLDGKNELWDSVVADHVLTGKDMKENNKGNLKQWSMEQMQAYFCVIRQINPVLSLPANKILSEYYRCHRRSDTRNAARTTIRLLESLIRLAEAHARLMYRETVEVQDAIAAITLMESSMQGASLLPTGSVLHSCFPENPEEEYKKHLRLVLTRIGLDDLLKTEIDNIAKRENASSTGGDAGNISDSHQVPLLNASPSLFGLRNPQDSNQESRGSGISKLFQYRNPMHEEANNVQRSFISKETQKPQNQRPKTFEIDDNNLDFLNENEDATSLFANFANQPGNLKTSTQNSSTGDDFDFADISDSSFLQLAQKQALKQTHLDTNTEMQSKKVDPCFSKTSFFSLNPSTVEEICDELAMEKENLLGEEFLRELRECDFPSTSQALPFQSNKRAGKENAFQEPQNIRSNLFKIDESNLDNDTESDFLNFDVDWSISQDPHEKRRKTLEL